jgi:hypothetical protein
VIASRFVESLEAGLSSVDDGPCPSSSDSIEERKEREIKERNRGEAREGNRPTMGFDVLSLLKRLQSVDSSVGNDGDGYPPSPISSPFEAQTDADGSDADGDSDTNVNPADEIGHGPSKTEDSPSGSTATHISGAGSDNDPETGDSNPASGPGTEQPFPGEGPGNEPNPSIGQTLPSVAEPTATEPPGPSIFTGTEVFAQPTIDPTATTTSSSAEEPTDTGQGIASSSGSGGGADGKKVAAIAVPVIVVCLALIAGLFFFMWRRKKRHTAQASGFNDETTAPDMVQTTAANIPPTQRPLPPINTVPTVAYDPAQTATRSSPQDPPQNTDTNNQRLSAISVQLQRAQQPTVVTTRPQSHVKRNSIQQGSTALTQENLASLGNTPQGYGYQRPRSPFEHPDDDAVSAISGLGPEGHNQQIQGREADEVSAISSLETPAVPRKGTQ